MPEIKICGLRRQQDIELAVRLGASFIGFILVPESPRYASPVELARVLADTDTGLCRKVGVFVNEDLTKVKEISQILDLDLVQLHGDESPEYCLELGLPYWKVFRVRDEDSLTSVGSYPCKIILLDSWAADVYGGTGRTFRVELAEKAVAESGKNVIIAGGLSPDNLAEILKVGSWGLDINSGIETEPGKKDHDKMRAVFDIVSRYGKS